jgi:hypothetical protein
MHLVETIHITDAEAMITGILRGNTSIGQAAGCPWRKDNWPLAFGSTLQSATLQTVLSCSVH